MGRQARSGRLAGATRGFGRRSSIKCGRAPPLSLSSAQSCLLLTLTLAEESRRASLGKRGRRSPGPDRGRHDGGEGRDLRRRLVMPDAWGTSAATMGAPLIPALAFAVVRMAYLALYLYVAADDRRLRVQLLLDAIPQSLGLSTLIGGAMLGGAAQTVLCAAAFAIDFGGARITSNFSGYKLRS